MTGNHHRRTQWGRECMSRKWGSIKKANFQGWRTNQNGKGGGGGETSKGYNTLHSSLPSTSLLSRSSDSRPNGTKHRIRMSGKAWQKTIKWENNSYASNKNEDQATSLEKGETSVKGSGTSASAKDGGEFPLLGGTRIRTTSGRPHITNASFRRGIS